MYSATSNRTLGLKKSDIYSDFLLFCQSFRPLRPFPRVPEIYIRSFGFALDLNIGFLYEYPKTFIQTFKSPNVISPPTSLISYSLVIISIPLVNSLYHLISVLFDVRPTEIKEGYAPIAAKSLKATAIDL